MTKEEFEKHLKKKYPILYKNLLNKKAANQLGYLLPVSFGIECGPGWYNLIDYVSSKLENLFQGIEVVQVKEKFGNLRVYLDHYTPEAEKITKFAEDESETTCEVCGKKGILITGGWYKVRCSLCKNK
jgi:hypothetical protein